MKTVYTVCLCLCSMLFCKAQENLDKELDSILKIELSTEKRTALEKLIHKNRKKSPKSLGKVYHELGLVCAYLGDTDKAIKITLDAVKLKEPYKKEDPDYFYHSLKNLPYLYKHIGNRKEEIATRLQVFKNPKFNSYYANAGVDLSYDYADQGDYFKAVEFADKVIETYLLHKNKKQLIKSHLAKIYALVKMDDSELARANNILYHKNEIEKRIKLLEDFDKTEFYLNLGYYYDTDKNFEEALYYYKKAETYNSEDNRRTIINLNIGKTYSSIQKANKAMKYYNEVIKTGDTIRISAVYNNLGYYHAKSIEEEIRYYRKAIELLGINIDSTKKIFFLEEIKESPHKMKLLYTLIDLSQAYIKQYNKSKEEQSLENALKTLYRIDDVISVMRLDSSTKLSKLFWINRSVNSYLEAVEVCFLLNKPSEAFYFMEKNKSLYLLEQLGKLELKNQFKIPSELIEREASLNYKVFLTRNKSVENQTNESLQNSYNKAYQNHTKFVDSLRREFPDYYNSRLSPKLISLSDFQVFLKEKNSQVVDYILGEEKGYGLWINEDTIHFFELDNYSKLVDNISFLKQVFSNPSLSKEEVDKYRKVGLETFKTLFPWKDALEQIQLKKLKIIPSAILYNFPFESLIVYEKPLLKDNFLINFAEVSYLNSASVSQSLYDTESVNSHSYLGIAPVNFQSKDLIDLKGSENVTQQIASLFSSELRLKEKATRQELLRTSKDALILHINTHAGIDEKTKLPWLSMQDSLVSLDEMYMKSQPHNLVFLDACKTADGKLQRGEGIESLSRAFFHSGSKSVIASQWNANEKATNEISLLFFQKLKKGSSKSTALRQAKLSYLENNQLSNTFPYFWASLTLTGNSDALPEVPNTYYYLIIIGIIPLIVLFFSRRKKRSV